MISKINDNIYIGDQLDALNKELLEKYKFDVVINLNNRIDPEEEKIVSSTGASYVEADYEMDFKEMLKNISYSLEEYSNAGLKTLVHCEAGIDRAPFVVALYFSTKNNIELSRAYNVVKYFRRQIMEHYEWV
jgi:protein-tyrosine phosphatase